MLTLSDSHEITWLEVLDHKGEIDLQWFLNLRVVDWFEVDETSLFYGEHCSSHALQISLDHTDLVSLGIDCGATSHQHLLDHNVDLLRIGLLWVPIDGALE